MNPVVKLGDNVHFNLTDNQKMLSHQRNVKKAVSHSKSQKNLTRMQTR